MFSIFVAISTSYERTKRLLGSRREGRLEDFVAKDYTQAVEETGGPWPHLYQQVDQKKLYEPKILSWPEWIGFLIIPLAVQMIQAFILACVTTVFFMWFGSIAIPDEVAGAWANAPHLEQTTLFTVVLPVKAVLTKVALVMGSFCALIFIATTSNDRRYAHEFLEPSLTRLRRVVMLRNIVHLVKAQPKP